MQAWKFVNRVKMNLKENFTDEVQKVVQMPQFFHTFWIVGLKHEDLHYSEYEV